MKINMTDELRDLELSVGGTIDVLYFDTRELHQKVEEDGHRGLYGAGYIEGYVAASGRAARELEGVKKEVRALIDRLEREEREARQGPPPPEQEELPF